MCRLLRAAPPPGYHAQPCRPMGTLIGLRPEIKKSAVPWFLGIVSALGTYTVVFLQHPRTRAMHVLTCSSRPSTAVA